MDVMNTLQLSVLIRTLFVFAMLALMVIVVIAGALIARRRAANPDPVVRRDHRPAPGTLIVIKAPGNGKSTLNVSRDAPRRIEWTSSLSA